jgi:hypothetical protein
MSATFRYLFGAYLVWHFAELIPYAEELFGPTGMIPDPYLIPTFGIFSNILGKTNCDPTLFLIVLTAVAILFTLGIYYNWMALILYYGWACLLNRNILITNPGIAYVGWLLLAFVLIEDDPKSLTNRKLKQCMWFLIVMGYTISGLHKLQAPSWTDGSALRHILESPISRDNILRDWLLQTPPIVLQINTWFALFLEISALPLGFFLYTKPLIWLALFAMNVGVVFLINFTDLTLGILLVQLFTAL